MASLLKYMTFALEAMYSALFAASWVYTPEMCGLIGSIALFFFICIVFTGMYKEGL